MFYLFKSTWKYADKDKWKLVVCYISHSVSFGGEFLQPFAFGMAVNALQTNGIEYLEPMIMWFGLYVVGFFIFEIFHRFGRYFECTTAMKNQQRIVDFVYAKLCKLPMIWHVDHHSGDIVNRIKVAGEALRDFGFSQSNYLGYGILSIGPIIVLVKVNYRIAIISLIIIIINMVIVFRLNKAIQPILDRQNESFHAFSARLSDFVSNIRTVISLKIGTQTDKELKHKFDAYYRENMREFWINQLRCFVMSFGAIITELTVIFLYIWSYRASNEVFLIGNLVMLVTYFRQMGDSIFQIADSFYDTMHWKASIKSVDIILNAAQKQEVLDCNQELSSWNQEVLDCNQENSSFNQEALDHNQQSSPFNQDLSSWNNLLIKNLSFNYYSNFELSEVDFELSRRSKIAIVGANGSGKSTVLHLLAGLYEPDCMKLFVDGIEHSSLNEMAGAITLISQEPEIFENTILYNITFGLEPDPAELEKAINTARFREVIERLPNGISTDIREKGANLSGGEKQRLALARGLYFSRAKSILLLDEITSSVDAINEKLIMQQILNSNKDRCVICSIHRLHLLDMFDNILVMDKGRIIQRGKFVELVNSEGHFKTLWEKYQVDEIREEDVGE